VPAEAELARKEGRDYEPASVLLDRILAERRRRWEEAELAKLKATGKAPTDGFAIGLPHFGHEGARSLTWGFAVWASDRWKKKYKEPSSPDTTAVSQLPEDGVGQHWINWLSSGTE
jgi:type I restriction enzyme S subunit